ncbi:MAG TPA: ThuA domain-containing protein [Candidatus Acidoferrum sp.]|nr:ThuA domain-containing protein [Candidatus Acidoferrum sp.]
MIKRIIIIIATLALTSSLAFAQSTPKHIVFLSGPKDHGMIGRHDYEADLRVLKDAFDNASNVPKVKTSIFVGKAPPAQEIADADVIVIESSSDRDANEVHPLFPPDPSTNHHGYDDATKAFLQGYDDLLKKGAGIVILHYANWAENWAARQYYLSWTGGLWVQIGSKNPVDQWTMQPVNTTHPVLNGIKQWTYRDEVFSRFLLPEDYRRTNLIMATPQQDVNHMGTQVASWAYQRDEGGRAFVFGGVDFHDNMLIDVYRRFILNGIWWAAHGKVPNEGIDSQTPKGIEPYKEQPPTKR